MSPSEVYKYIDISRKRGSRCVSPVIKRGLICKPGDAVEFPWYIWLFLSSGCMYTCRELYGRLLRYHLACLSPHALSIRDGTGARHEALFFFSLVFFSLISDRCM